jgi:cyclohexa-1,5-dienecarbonyl-CoA hydratase
MIAALRSAIDEYATSPGLSAVLLEADGPHFSFGASVEEHLPDQCADMLAGLHRLILAMLSIPVPILAAVRGQCLGGGLEVACTASRIFAAPDARFGQPEITLAVFAPAASCLLPRRIGQYPAEDLLLTGRSVAADEALDMGLVQQVVPEPQQAALAWFDEYIAPLSASSLQCAVRAARGPYLDEVRVQIERVERLYLDELMASNDAVEGLNAFVEKRPANWEHR